MLLQKPHASGTHNCLSEGSFQKQTLFKSIAELISLDFHSCESHHA